VITLTVTSRANDAGPIDRSRAHSAELSPHSVDGPDADTGPDLLDGLPAEAPETVQIEIEVSK